MKYAMMEITVLALAAVGIASPAQASLTISAKPTKYVSCNAAGVCTSTRANAVFNVADLENRLAGSNATVKSTAPAGDIDVEAGLTWASGNTLTLDSYHSLVVKAPVADTGSGALDILTNDGGSGGTLSFEGKGNVTLFSAANFLSINGQSYGVLFDVAGLAAAISDNPQGHFALGASYNAAADGTYAHPPIAAAFTGTLEGLGNRISHLSLADKTPAEPTGLFSRISTGGIVRDLELVTVHVSGTDAVVGGFVATNSQGTLISLQIVDGSVTDTATDKTSPNAPGVTVGGLAGENDGTIQFSRSTANVAANVSDKKGIGASAIAGGLVGLNSGLAAFIQYSWAGGPVAIDMNSPSGRANCYAGGLVGENFVANIVNNSFAVGSATVTGGCFAQSGVGGLVGYNENGTIDRASASGAATGVNFNYVGGLIGGNENLTVCGCGGVTNSVATGAALGGNDAYVGGFIGENLNIDVANGIASGTVNGGPGSDLGGFVGVDAIGPSSNFSNDGWNTTTSNITSCSQGAGNVANDPGIKGTTC